MVSCLGCGADKPVVSNDASGPRSTSKPQEWQVWHQLTCFRFYSLLLLYWIMFFLFCPCSPLSRFHYTHGFIPSLLSPLFSSSPDVGAGPGGSCCSLQFVSVKHQLVSEGACARLLGHSCSSAAALDFYSFSWKRGRGRFYRLSQ